MKSTRSNENLFDFHLVKRLSNSACRHVSFSRFDASIQAVRAIARKSSAPQPAHADSATTMHAFICTALNADHVLDRRHSTRLTLLARAVRAHRVINNNCSSSYLLTRVRVLRYRERVDRCSHALRECARIILRILAIRFLRRYVGDNDLLDNQTHLPAMVFH